MSYHTMYVTWSAAASGVTLTRCLQTRTPVTLIPLQVALLALAAALITSRVPYIKYGRFGKVSAQIAIALALSPWFNNTQDLKLSEWLSGIGTHPHAKLSLLQIAGFSSVAGYIVFVEIARLYLGIGQTPVTDTNVTDTHSKPTDRSQSTSNVNQAVLAQEARENAETYDARKRLLLSTKHWHNVGLAILSSAMFAGIVRSCAVSGKFARLDAFLCKPFKEDTVFVVTAHAFFWSKFWEWWDSALLLASGKDLTWLHYTHHASTAVLTVLNMRPTYNAMWSLVCASNSFVHAWMYAYYVSPRGILYPFRKALTQSQIVQHGAVLVSAVYVLRKLDWSPANPIPGVHISIGKHSKPFSVSEVLDKPIQGTKQAAGHEQCANNPLPIVIGLGLYGMYMFFFVVFYLKTYVDKRRPQSTSQSSASEGISKTVKAEAPSASTKKQK